MINRVIRLPRKDSFFLLGPRQTGKSTWIRHLYPDKVWAIDLLLTDVFLKYSKEPQLFRREAIRKIQAEGVRHVFVDEIQRVPLLLNEVQHLIDHYPSCQFILTGSSARKLKRGAANLLGGRVFIRYLFPFTHQEIGKDFSLDDVLQFGSLPAVYGRSAKDKIEILKSYAQTYLREEIQAEGVVRNLGGFSRFLDLAAGGCNELINFTAIGREAQLPTRTVQSYYDILEDTLIGIRLEGWRKSRRKRLSIHPKFYLFDTGVTNSLNRRLSEPIELRTKGKLFEQWVVLETFRLLHYLGSEGRLFYWRTNSGAEVDLLIERAGKIRAACEIKISKHVSGADLTGLRSFRQDYPQVPLYVLANVESGYTLDNVSVLPWQEYLKKLPDFL